MIKCVKCKTRITTHLWIVGDDAFCSASCERNGKSQFEKTYRALRDMWKTRKQIEPEA